MGKVVLGILIMFIAAVVLLAGVQTGSRWAAALGLLLAAGGWRLATVERRRNAARAAAAEKDRRDHEERRLVAEARVTLEKRLNEARAELDAWARGERVPDWGEKMAMAEMLSAGRSYGPVALEEHQRICGRPSDPAAPSEAWEDWRGAVRRNVLDMARVRLMADLECRHPWTEPRRIAPPPLRLPPPPIPLPPPQSVPSVSHGGH